MNHLDAKTIIVTGASAGIGAVTSKALAAEGAKVVAVGRNVDRLDSLVAEIRSAGGEATSYATDVTVRKNTAELAQFTLDTYGAIDILVNNAGLMLFSQWSDLAVDDWDKMIDTNVKGYLYMIAGVLPTMLEQGSSQILNMDSIVGHRADPSAGVYSSTKFFIQAMTESMRKDLGVNHGIRVSTISPGVINTEWVDKVNDPEGRKAAEEMNKVAIDPSDVASAVVYSLNQAENVTVNDLIISPTRQDW